MLGRKRTGKEKKYNCQRKKIRKGENMEEKIGLPVLGGKDNLVKCIFIQGENFQTRRKLSYKEKIVIQGENAEEKIGLEASTGGSLLAGAAWCKGRSSGVGNR